MLFGAIGFSYDNTAHLQRSFARRGVHSVNLGDNLQSLAVRHLYQRLGVPPDRVVRVDRDRMADYDGPPVVLPMNAVFPAAILPPSAKVIPIFIGFHAAADTIRAHRDWLASHPGPIGCRDPATAGALRAEGIDADVTGCLTLSLPTRTAPPEFRRGRVLVVSGEGAGMLPPLALKSMPEELLARAEFIVQRRDMTRLPLTQADMEDNERISAALLARYRAEAALVVTSLHHAAAPCLATGIPTIVVRSEASSRFGFLERLIKVHLEKDFGEIDWAPSPVNLRAVRAAQWARFQAALTPYL
jgi:hypothetical protein